MGGLEREWEPGLRGDLCAEWAETNCFARDTAVKLCVLEWVARRAPSLARTNKKPFDELAEGLDSTKSGRLALHLCERNPGTAAGIVDLPATA